MKRKIFKFSFVIFSLIIFNLSSNALTCEEAYSLKKPFIIVYTMERCSACKQFMPIFYEVYSKIKNKYNFVEVDVYHSNSKYCDTSSINFVPTVEVHYPNQNRKIYVSRVKYFDKNLLEDAIKSTEQ